MTPDRAEILAKKGNVLKSGLGLQIWGDDFLDDPSAGDAGSGTASRQASVPRARKPSSGDEPIEP